MKWTIGQLIAAGSLGVMYTVLIILGSSISTIVGVPIIGGLINVLFGSIVFAFSCLVIRKFGSATITGLIYGITALPLPVLGAAGFLPKIIIGFGGGLVADAVFLIFRKNDKIAAPMLGGFSETAIGALIIIFGFIFGLPIAPLLLKLFKQWLAYADFVIGAIGGLLGFLIYNNLRNTTVVRRLQQ